MKYCKTCNIYYENNLSHCIFCSNSLTTISEKDCADTYPSLLKKTKWIAIFKKIMNYLFILASSSCILIDFLTTKQTENGRISWSAYVLLSCILAYCIMNQIFSKNKKFHKFYLCSLFCIGYLVSISLIMKDTFWAINYVLPYCLLALSLFSTAGILGGKRQLEEHFIYAFCSGILSLLPLLLYLFHIATKGLPVLLCSLYAALLLSALFVFTTTTSKLELKKRFYL